MGNSNSTSSTVKNINNGLYVSKSTFNQLNQQLNSVIANTVTKTAVKSGGTIINNQVIYFKNITAHSDVIISDVNQRQEAAFTFSAVNMTQARNDAAAQFLQQTLDTLSNHVDQNIGVVMDSNAQNSIKSGLLDSLPVSSNKSNSDVVNESTITSLNTTNKNITSILQNRIKNNFTTDTLTNCIAGINNSQMFNAVNISSATGTVRILNITQSQAATAVANCKGITDATNRILTETLGLMRVNVDESNSVDSNTTSTASTKTEVVSEGLFQTFANLFGSFTNIFYVIFILIFVVLAYLSYRILAGLFGRTPTRSRVRTTVVR
jgi:hypothetical protein